MGINSNNINGNYAIAEDGTIKRPYSELDTAMLNIIRVGANKDDILAAYKARKKCYQLCKERTKRPDYKEYVETLQLDNFPNEFKKAELGKKYLRHNYPQENESCEWKEFKYLKNSFSGHEKDDIISYVSAISNMNGGHLVIGIEDETLKIIGIDTYNYDKQKAILRLTERCVNLSTEGLYIDEYITDDTNKKIWIIHIPKHRPKLPVYAHNKAWQRIEDSLVEMTSERLNAILEENSLMLDWSAELIDDASLSDLDSEALKKARTEYKVVHPRLANEVDLWDDMEFLCRSGVAIKNKKGVFL